MYILSKCVYTITCIVVAYIMISDFVIPSIEKGEEINAIELLLRICLPMCIFWILIFYIIWELILNVFAEITRFGDRQFY